MSLTDVEINRAANALATTLNDQRVPGFDAERIGAIACGAVSGRLLGVQRDATRPAAGWVVDGDERLVEIERREPGTWVVRRLSGPRSRAYRPPDPEGKRARGGSPAPDAFSGTDAAPDVGQPVDSV